MSSSMTVDARNWGTADKCAARDAGLTICRRAMGMQALPPQGQYWTMCGQLFDSATGLVKLDAEYDQVVRRARFATPDQYYGVEVAPEIAIGNQTALAGTGAHLFEGDILTVMSRSLLSGQFHPSVINLDTMSEPRSAVDLLCDTMDLVNHVDGPVVVLVNVVLWCRRTNRRYDSLGAVTEALTCSPSFHLRSQRGWRQTEGHETFSYTNWATNMAMFALIREGAACSG